MIEKILSPFILIFCGYVLFDSLRSKKVFVSYKYIEDSRYKNLLIAWSKNHKFEIDFDDVSSDISIDSFDANVIKEGIFPHIEKADFFLCLIGELTHKSEMVNWEIQQALKLKKRIVAVKLSKSFITPKSLLNCNAQFAMSFKEKEVVGAMKKAGF